MTCTLGSISRGVIIPEYEDSHKQYHHLEEDYMVRDKHPSN